MISDTGRCTSMCTGDATRRTGIEMRLAPVWCSNATSARPTPGLRCFTMVLCTDCVVFLNTVRVLLSLGVRMTLMSRLRDDDRNSDDGGVLGDRSTSIIAF